MTVKHGRACQHHSLQHIVAADQPAKLGFCGVAEYIVASIAGSSSEMLPRVYDTAYVDICIIAVVKNLCHVSCDDHLT
jgi:hypothetical protein